MLHPITDEEIYLTKEQQSCVDYVGNKRKDLVVMSAAGGGKSLVLMARAMKYLQEAKENHSRNAVVIFTYNHVLAHVIKEWMCLSEDDERYIRVCTLHEYIDEVYKRMPGSKLGNQAYDGVKTKALQDALQKFATLGKTNKYKEWGMSFWFDEFDWMRGMDIFDYTDNAKYFEIEVREGRGHTHRMLREDRIAAFGMYMEYQAALRKKKVYDGGVSGDERILYVSHHEDQIPEDMKFDHVMIDEAQDQTLAKIIALKKLARYDVTICMDANQRIYSGRWNYKQAGMEVQSKKLTVPFRCTTQIDAFAESLKMKNQKNVPEDDQVEHIVPTANGEKPELVKCGNEDEERRYLIALVKKWLHDDPEHTIGILCYENKAVEKIERWLNDANIDFQLIDSKKDSKYSISEPGVKLCTIHTSKGLEFMRVILPQFYQGMIPNYWAINKKNSPEAIEENLIKERNVAYVGMTRAMHQLVILYNGRRSQFMDEIDKSLYIERCFEEATKKDLVRPTTMYEKRVVPALEKTTETIPEAGGDTEMQQKRRKRNWQI